MNRTKIVFLVLPRVHLLDLAGAVQVFQEAIEYGADIVLEYCSFQHDLTSSSEFPLGKLKHFNEVKLDSGDYLFIPGSEVEYIMSRTLLQERALMGWVRRAHTNGVILCSVCTGAFFLGLTGILDGRKCTTHWKRTAQLKKLFPGINLQEDILFTEDHAIYTSAGVTAGIDMALTIVGKISDDTLSFKVARELVVYLRRTGNESQQSVFMKYRNHIHSGIHKAQDYLQANIRKKISLSQLADKACMSTRNLTRIFKKETGITINEYTTLLRQEMIRSFAKDPDMRRKQMANHLGLKSARQVSRLMQNMKSDKPNRL